MGIAADGEQQGQAEATAPGQARATTRCGRWPLLPPEQAAECEAWHHQQCVADGDRKRIVGTLRQKQSKQSQP